jgi:8-hydroxy-5-deazaflavin:NADPH oxidoreductase
VRIGILGTGVVGTTLAGGWLAAGHDVRLGSRTPDNPTAARWAADHGDRAGHGTFADVAGFPPSLFVEDTDSLGEQVQHASPEARVDKALNTVTASVMVDPGALSAPTDLFVAARGTEMYLPLWIRTMQALGTATFNISVVR